MENKAIVEIAKYPVAWADFSDLPEDQIAMFGLVSYVATELNCLQRVYIASAQALTGEDYLDVGIAAQRYTLLRVWSAKLFEIMDCIEGLSALEKTTDSVVKEIATAALEAMEQLKNDAAYPLVRSIRHEATSHYSFKAAKKNIAHVSRNANCNMYLHTMDGNSYYPMGEELMFVGRINRFGSSLTEKDEKIELLNSWMDWNLRANGWMRSIHVMSFEKILLSQHPDRSGWSSKHYVPTRLVGETKEPVVPLFMKRVSP